MHARKMRCLNILAMALAISQIDMAAAYDFNDTQKNATSYTAQSNQQVYKELDFNNKAAYADVDRGYIAPLLNNGNIEGGVYDATALNFMQNKPAPDTVNPSLWRMAQLVNRGGLYKVADHIYQVRGQDLVNLTIIESDNGIILYDIEYAPVALKKSVELYEKYRGKHPLKGVIISHSHADHFGGYGGIIDAGLATQEDFTSGKIPLIVPVGFLEQAVSENVMAGNIMARRAGYQYGNVLKPEAKGMITASLGAALANGASTLPIPNREIKQDGEKVNIDGVEFEFYLTPGAEAPAEMVFYIAKWKAMSMAEELNHLEHNIYSLRGTQTRDASVWASYLAGALARWGKDVQVQFGPHTWPLWGNKEIVEYLKNQRDLYQSIYDTTLRYANYGYGPDEIAEHAQLPKSVLTQWDNRPYYGNTKNNLKSTYIRSMGWFDGNPTKLAMYPDAEKGKRYVDVIGGEDKVVDAATKAFEKGDYRFTADLLNNIIAYNPNNKKANYLMADALEQLGYQEENTLYRNLYLSGAKELRMGGNVPNGLSTTSADVIATLPPDLFMSYLGMTIDQIKAEKMGNFMYNLDFTGGKKFNVDLHHGVFNTLADQQLPAANVSLTISQPDFMAFVSGKSAMDDLVKSGKAKITGDAKALDKLVGLFDMSIKNNMNLVLPLQPENQIK